MSGTGEGEDGSYCLMGTVSVRGEGKAQEMMVTIVSQHEYT